MLPRTNAQWNINDKYDRKVDEDTETVVSAGGGGTPKQKKSEKGGCNENHAYADPGIAGGE